MARRREPQKTWIEDPTTLGQVADLWEGEHRPRHAAVKGWLRNYYQRPIAAGVDYSRLRSSDLAVWDALQELTIGLTREVVDASTATICRAMAAEVLPRGADFKLEQGCKAATRLIEGVFDNSDFLNIGTQAWRDCETADIGVVKGYIDPLTNEIRWTKIDPLCFLWPLDGTDNPRTVIEESPVERDELIARFPRKRSEIEDADSWQPALVMGVDQPNARRSRDATTVKVIEAYARALGPGHPGRHSIALANGTVLEDEKWEHEITPYAVCRFQEDFRGFAGISLARMGAPYHNENQQLVRQVLAGLAGAVPWLLTHEDSDVDGVSDLPYQRVNWTGSTPPQIYMPQAVSQQVLDRMASNRATFFALGGVNEGIASGNAPARYTSGAAQRAYVDIATTRLLPAQQQWERLWRRAAMIVVMLAQQAKKVHVRVKGSPRYELVSWPSLDRNKMQIDFGLASGLGLTPAARLQDLQDLKDAGVIDQQDVVRHLQLPDTQELADRVNAPRELIARQISRALDDGVFETPSAMQGPDGLGALVTQGSQEYQRAKLEGIYPPAHMEVLRRLILAAKARLEAIPPQAPAAPVAPANDNAAAPAAPAAAG